MFSGCSRGGSGGVDAQFQGATPGVVPGGALGGCSRGGLGVVLRPFYIEISEAITYYYPLPSIIHDHQRSKMAYKSKDIVKLDVIISLGSSKRYHIAPSTVCSRCSTLESLGTVRDC